MACTLSLDLLMVTVPQTALVISAFTRDWQTTMFWWMAFVYPTTFPFWQLDDTRQNVIVFHTLLFLGALLFAWVGQGLSYAAVWPRLFDLRSLREAYRRVWAWEGPTLGIGALLLYAGIVGLTGHFSQACSFGIAADEALIISIGLTVVGGLCVLAALVVAIGTARFDRIDRRLNIKYFAVLALRLAIIAVYIHMAIGGLTPWNAVAYVLALAVYWAIFWVWTGFISARGVNRNFLRDGSTFEPDQDRWARRRQVLVFAVSVGGLDVVSSIALVITSYLTGFDYVAVFYAITGAALVGALSWFLMPMVNMWIGGLAISKLRAQQKMLEIGRVDTGVLEDKDVLRDQRRRTEEDYAEVDDDATVELETSSEKRLLPAATVAHSMGSW